VTDRKADRHKNRAIPFRPLEEDGAWLRAEAESTGQPVNTILRRALRVYRELLDARHSAKISR
jgi:hypothetical protein